MFYSGPLGQGVWGSKRVKKSLRQEYAELLGEEVFDLPVDRLTEWQKYDLIYTRIYLQNPKVVFCVQPFKSAEVALRIHIMELLERFLNKGIPVVIMAVNLADSLALADGSCGCAGAGRYRSITGMSSRHCR